MTARLIQAEKFYQKLQKKFSRRINLDLSRIKSALQKIPLDPNIDISGKIVNILGQTENVIGNSSILLYIYEDGAVRKTHMLNH